MTRIISSTVLRNSYSEVSESCHADGEPIFVTKNGNGDLAIMGVEVYENLNNRLEFYEFLMQGRKDVDAGRVIPAADVSKNLRADLEL